MKPLRFILEIFDSTILEPNWYHGSPSGDLKGGISGIHLGTKKAAEQALHSRIGIPASGSWDGRREYGKTLLAGKKSLKKIDSKVYNITGYNVDAPEEDYYPSKMPTFSNREEVLFSHKPSIKQYKIIGPMTNTPFNPHSDIKANALMKASLKKGNAKKGYYYKNEGEDVGSISAVVPNSNHLKELK